MLYYAKLTIQVLNLKLHNFWLQVSQWRTAQPISKSLWDFFLLYYYQSLLLDIIEGQMKT